MTDEQAPRRTLNLMLTVAALMIVVAGLRAAEDIVIPFLLAAFISTIAATPMFWLERRGVPNGLALLAVVVMIVVVGAGLGALIGSSVHDFTDSVPVYEKRLRELSEHGIALLDGYGIDVSRDLLVGYFDPGFAMRMVGRTMSGLGGVLSNTFLILLTVIFILLEARSFPSKLGEVLSDPDGSLPRFRSFATTMNRYMAIKTSVSLVTGILVYLLNVVIGVDFPVLWAVLAFLLNYVPNIGSIIAAVPAILLASVQLDPGHALVLGAGYFGINTLMGNAVEPRFMGRGLGLSTLVVWLSLVFWGWALGPVGMLLSVPLTVTLRIALENQASTHWIAVLLGPETELRESEPDEGEAVAGPDEDLGNGPDQDPEASSGSRATPPNAPS